MEQLMDKTIRIPNELYRRLESHASGFDTPSNVISRILDMHESVHGKPADRDDPAADRNLATESSVATDTSERNTNIQLTIDLDIVYVSGSKERFKRALLVSRKAYIKICYTDGKTEYKLWKASKFCPTSDVRNNLLSGHLRKWRERGIYKAILSVNREDLAADFS